MNRLLIFGAGGHGLVVADAAAEVGRWREIAFVDDKPENELPRRPWPVLCNTGDTSSLRRQFTEAVAAFGNNQQRMDLIDKLLDPTIAFELPAIVHPTAYVSRSATIGAGAVILAQAVVNAAAVVGKGCIVNTSASIDHECVLDDGVHVSPGAHVAGGVRVGRCAWIGIGSSVCEGVRVGEGVVVGAGAAVIKDVRPGARVIGVPAKESNGSR